MGGMNPQVKAGLIGAGSGLAAGALSAYANKMGGKSDFSKNPAGISPIEGTDFQETIQNAQPAIKPIDFQSVLNQGKGLNFSGNPFIGNPLQ